MKAIFVLFDTLSRRFLETYGNDRVITPNFKRLQKKAVMFENHYAGSLPCMPARRELHTGRYNFLHRYWGPIEPFDVSFVETLKENGVYTHIVTDHSHYWEDGGATYLQRYHTWEGFRGQEGDRWMPVVNRERLDIPEQLPTAKHSVSLYHNYANRKEQRTEEEMSGVRTMMRGIDFICENAEEDRWFLQIECFDPHEPFFVPQKYLDLYQDDYDGAYFDWPAYKEVTETPEEMAHLTRRYAALITMCDHYLGKILDVMDEKDLWKDTMLVVTTDHGFLMGEHNWTGKNIMPQYQEIAHLPLFYYDPRHPESGTSDILTQTIDFAPTILDFFGRDIDAVVQGKSIYRAMESKEEIRDAGLFGVFGAHVNVMDKEWVYMRAPATAENRPLYEYTLMPTRMRGFLSKEELEQAEIVRDFTFTRGYPVLKVPSLLTSTAYETGNLLFHIKEDEEQRIPVSDKVQEERMIEKLVRVMKESEADISQFIRLGLKDRY